MLEEMKRGSVEVNIYDIIALAASVGRILDLCDHYGHIVAGA